MPLKYAKLCRAKARTQNYRQCQQPAMPNGLCRMHFGKGYGPKTTQGKINCGQANYKHGLYTRKAFEERKIITQMMSWYKDIK